MSLFQYKVSLLDGKTKGGQITAKTEAVARATLQARYRDGKVLSIQEKPVTSRTTAKAPVVKAPVPARSPAPAKPPVATKPTLPMRRPAGPAKPTTKLEKLLYLQSNKCFFCGRELTKAEASIEHLQPKSGGGDNADGNVVACCVSLNRLFGSISLKEKMRIILDKAGHFTCPRELSTR